MGFFSRRTWVGTKESAAAGCPPHWIAQRIFRCKPCESDKPEDKIKKDKGKPELQPKKKD